MGSYPGKIKIIIPKIQPVDKMTRTPARLCENVGLLVLFYMMYIQHMQTFRGVVLTGTFSLFSPTREQAGVLKIEMSITGRVCMYSMAFVVVVGCRSQQATVITPKMLMHRHSAHKHIMYVLYQHT